MSINNTINNSINSTPRPQYNLIGKLSCLIDTIQDFKVVMEARLQAITMVQGDTFLVPYMTRAAEIISKWLPELVDLRDKLYKAFLEKLV